MNKQISAADCEVPENLFLAFRSRIQKAVCSFLRFTEADVLALLSGHGLYVPTLAPSPAKPAPEQRAISGVSALLRSGRWIDRRPGPIPIGVHAELIGRSITSRKQVRR